MTTAESKKWDRLYCIVFSVAVNETAKQFHLELSLTWKTFIWVIVNNVTCVYVTNNKMLKCYCHHFTGGQGLGSYEKHNVYVGLWIRTFFLLIIIHSSVGAFTWSGSLWPIPGMLDVNRSTPLNRMPVILYVYIHTNILLLFWTLLNLLQVT